MEERRVWVHSPPLAAVPIFNFYTKLTPAGPSSGLTSKSLVFLFIEDYISFNEDKCMEGSDRVRTAFSSAPSTSALGALLSVCCTPE